MTFTPILKTKKEFKPILSTQSKSDPINGFQNYKPKTQGLLIEARKAEEEAKKANSKKGILKNALKAAPKAAKDTVVGMGQASNRAFSAGATGLYDIGSKVLGTVFPSSKPTLQANRPVLTPQTQFQKDLYGTDKAITPTSAGRELRMAKDPNAPSTGVLGRIDPALGLFAGLADAVPGGQGAKKGVQQGLKAGVKAVDEVKGALPKAKQVFEGFQDLTTKSLERLKGKSSVSRQFIEDMTNQPDLKQAERDTIRNILKDEGDTVDVPNFANKVKSGLLPLKRDKANASDYSRYENIVLPDDVRGPVADYSEHVYQSPIKTSAGDVHFGGLAMFKDDTPGGYFAHSRIEDLPNSAVLKSKDLGEPLGDVSASGGTTRRVIEIQSDLFQKGRLEGERPVVGKMNAGNGMKVATEEDLANFNKLEPYRNTWHERVIREEVKQAAIDGKTKLQFPTGETAMKIEGLGDNQQFFDTISSQRLTPDDLKVGKEFGDSGIVQGDEAQKWIITDVLGDGKFKAIPIELAAPNSAGKLTAEKGYSFLPDGRAYKQHLAESFDISGKVDTSNPIYKFYEKEVGRYLTNKYGAKRIVDAQGVSWYEIDTNGKGYDKAPVEAFGAIAGFEKDEEGKLKFNPQKAGIGILGVAGMTQGKKLFKANPQGQPQPNLQTQGILAKTGTPTQTPTEATRTTGILSKQEASHSLNKPYTSPKTKSSVSQSLQKAKTNVVEYVQNTQERVRQLVNRADVKVDDTSDPYLKETLYHGRVEAKIRVAREETKAIINDLKINGLSKQDVSDYLRFRHAPERNLAIGERAAGVSTQEAQEGLARLQSSPKGTKLAEIAERVQKLNNQTLELLKESGVISDELFNSLRTKYKNHVPLNRIMEDTDDFAGALSGKGFDVRSTGIKSAKGSEKEVSDILGNVVHNYEQAVLRAEKNIVDQATLNFARQNKDVLEGLIKETKLPIIPVAKVKHKGQVFNEVMDKVSELVEKYGGTMERKLKTRSMFGSFSPGENKIVTRFGTSKDTLIHEFGHMLDTKFNLKGSDFFDRETLVELRKVADLRKGRQAYTRKGEEKIAEFISMYFSDLANARKVAPITTRKFTKFLEDKPELRELSGVMKSRSRMEEVIEETVFARQQFTNDPSILTMRENGKPVYLKIEDPHLAIALRGIGREKLGGLMNMVAKFTRFYSGLATRFNPEFALPNKLRDLQEVAVYMSSQKGAKSAAGTVLRDPGSTKDVLAALRGKNTEGARLYNEMVAHGGTTGGMGLSTRAKVQLDIEKLERLANSKTRRIGNNLVEYIDNFNTIFEDSTRLSVYKQALADGLSKDRAAFLAKEASINFNRMGKGGPVINALYMFANASIQGSTKMMRALKNPKVLGGTVLAVGGAVATVNEWNDKVDPEWREKIPKWDKLNSLPVMIPSTDGGVKYISIPVSWGLKPIKVMADHAYDSMRGNGFNTREFLDDTTTAILEAYNPVGGTDVTSALTPTILDIPTDIARNRAWHGGMIRPDWDKNAPKDIQYFDSLRDTKTGQTAISITEMLQSKANIAISPADLKYAFESYIGGAGRTTSKVTNLFGGALTQQLPPADEYPFLSRFYRERTKEEVESGMKIEESSGTLLEDQAREKFQDKNRIRPIYEQVQQLNQTNPEEAKKIVDSLSEEDYEMYKNIRTGERSKRTETLRTYLNSNPTQAVEYLRSQSKDEQSRLLKVMTEEEYAIYKSAKETLQ